MSDHDQDTLDAAFAAARRPDPAPSEALMARVLADAEAAQSRPATREPRPTRWSGFFDLLGGWPAVSGLAAAGVAGLWLGLAPPASVEDLAGTLLGNVTEVSILGDLDGFALEELSDG